MNQPTNFIVPEDYTIQHKGMNITGRVLERSIRRIAIQLVEPFGLLHTSVRVHPSVGGALGFEGTAGDAYKVHLLISLYERARQLNEVMPLIVSTVNGDSGLRNAVIRTLEPVIGSYLPYNAHSFLLATFELRQHPVVLPEIPLTVIPKAVLDWPDTQVLLYKALRT